MLELTFTLLADGSSDRALIPVLKWLLIESGICVPIQGEYGDLRFLAQRPRKLEERIRTCVDLYPSDILFVHRDAESLGFNQRRTEIERAWRSANTTGVRHCVPVVPVRMQEAWFLCDEAAIRWAAGNPNGKIPLDLPATAMLERLPDPKQCLFNLFRHASGLPARRLGRFNPEQRLHRLASRIESFAPLRSLAAFQSLEAEIRGLVESLGPQYSRL